MRCAEPVDSIAPRSPRAIEERIRTASIGLPISPEMDEAINKRIDTVRKSLEPCRRVATSISPTARPGQRLPHWVPKRQV
jgi:hypothetical protein